MPPEKGRPAPPGATPTATGVNFSLPARDAAAVELLLFAAEDAPLPDRVLPLDPEVHRTGEWWHVQVPGAGHGQIYAWRVTRADTPATADKVLLDPWGRAVVGLERYDRRAARRPGDNAAVALRNVVIDPDRYDWEDDVSPAPPDRELIYETHVAAFTRDPSSGVAEPARGTFAGVADRVDHLRDLGVTTVEFMPVACFDPGDAPPGLVNYWGYSPVSWFAPHPGWSSDRSPEGPLREFRDMVKALHRAGLRVMLDVVFNHTAEGEADGPVFCWRGLDPATWYIHDDQGSLADFTGCGNTVNANHPLVRNHLRDALCWWVEHMHVDGFRFDLAAALARDTDGTPLDKPPLLADLAAEPRLAGVTLVAEPWDTGGHHLVGRLPGERMGFWNGRFRDDMRSFLRGDEGQIEAVMARIVGSRDLLADPAGGPHQVINFVTCHDGFTLADLVAFDGKHNRENGEDNRDGSDHNLSWNSGHEGQGAPPAVAELRRWRQRNFVTLLLLSHGQPLLLAGDEFGQTRRGNNNPWCQDNDLNWLDWTLRETNADLLRFCREAIAFAGGITLLQQNRFWRATGHDGPGDISWHGRKPAQPDWTTTSRLLAYTLEDTAGPERVHVMLNGSDEAEGFLPPPPSRGSAWRRIIDTARPSPEDILPRSNARLVEAGPVELAPYSVIVLLDAEMK